jgi:hypothetical protein
MEGAAAWADSMDPRVLLVHPYNHMEPDAVPVGTVGLVNLLPGKALGRFASEVTPDEIRAARVVLIDVHWFFPLAVLAGMADAIRRINPAVKIVVGGIASAFYADVFFERYAVDYVTTGDVEPVFPLLVGHLLAGEEPPPLAGVWSRRGPPPPGPRIRVPEFDAIDWLTIGWFPTYRSIVHGRHAMYRASQGGSAPLCYPYLPVTRGCRRACEFCYGAYHERVFGRGIRMRAPEVLARDLRAIEADPGLAFVSILFADEGLMEPYAEALAGLGLALDAFLYFCGNATSRVLDQVRSGFAGAVSFSIIQASDLAPLPADPPLEAQSEAQRALVAHLAGMARTGAVIYHVSQPPAPEVLALSTPGSPIQSESGKDWEVVRPNATLLREDEGYGPREQLDDVIAAGRSASAWHIARLLVPTLRAVLDTRDYRDDLFHARDMGDATAARIASEYRESLRGHHVYGFASIELALRGAAAAGWARPEGEVVGSCAWTAGLNGFGWEGEATVGEEGPAAVGPCPVLRAWDGSPIDLAAWPRTLLPALAVARGPRRTVRVGGMTTGAHLTLWVEDGGARTEHRLPHGLGVIEAEVVAGGKHVRGREITPDCQRTLWPAPTWPASVREELRARPVEALTAALRLRHFHVEPTHLEIALNGEGGEEIAMVVFPRAAGGAKRYLGTERFAFAYKQSSGSMDLAGLHRSFEEALRRVERRLGLPGRRALPRSPI